MLISVAHGWHRLGWHNAGTAPALARQQEYDRLADAVEAAIDWGQFEHLTGLSLTPALSRSALGKEKS